MEETARRLWLLLRLLLLCWPCMLQYLAERHRGDSKTGAWSLYSRCSDLVMFTSSIQSLMLISEHDLHIFAWVTDVNQQR